MSDRPVSETSDNTQHWQEIDIHDLGGIRTRNPSRRAGADRLDRGNKQGEQLFTPMIRYQCRSCLNSARVRQYCQSYNYKFQLGSNHRPKGKWHEPSKLLRQRCGCRRQLNVMWRLNCWGKEWCARNSLTSSLCLTYATTQSQCQPFLPNHTNLKYNSLRLV